MTERASRRIRGATRCAILVGLLLGQPAGLTAQATPTAGVLLLRDVYRALDSGNQRLVAARHGVGAALARVGPAKAFPDPSLQFGLMNRNPPGLGPQDPLGMAQVQVLQMLPITGRLGIAGKVMEAKAGAASARAADLTWELRARAAMAFYELYRLDHTTAVAVETQSLLRDVGTTARSLYSVGQGRQADVLRSQVETDRMSEEIGRMRAMRSAVAARLNALLNRPSSTPVPTPALPRFPASLPSADSLEALAMAGRPMLAAGAREIDAAYAEQRLARTESWPDLELGMVYGRRPKVGGGVDQMVSLMMGFTLPLHTGNRQAQRRRETDEMRLSAEAELSAMRAETRGRLGELLAEVQRARTLRELYRLTILPQADATFTSAMGAYRAGEVDLLTLLDARVTVYRYRQQVFQLDAEEGAALAEMEMLLGQPLFDPAASAPAPGEVR